MKFTHLIVAAAWLAAGAAGVRADVVYSTFGPGNSYSVIGYDISSSLIVGGAFTPGFTGMLTSVDVAIADNFGSDNPTVTLSLAANNPLTNLPVSNGYVPLGDLTATTPGGAIETLTPSTPVPLLSGTKYWLVMTPATSNSQVDWFVSFASSGGTAASFNGGGTYRLEGANAAFDINATPTVTGVPEPSAWAMVVVAGAGAAAAQRRRAA